jgi:hypothetical protein
MPFIVRSVCAAEAVSSPMHAIMNDVPSRTAKAPRIWTAENPANRFASERRPHPFFYTPWLGFGTGAGANTAWVPGLGLPTLAECSHGNWRAGEGLPLNSTPPPPHALLRSPLTPDIAAQVNAVGEYDAWVNPNPWDTVDPLTGTMAAYSGSRVGEDVVLTNVISFDVKAWDPTAPVLPDATGNAFLLPGDPAYVKRFNGLRSTIVSGTLPATGAYADLNFLARVPIVLYDHDNNASTPNIPSYPDNPVFDASGNVLRLAAPLFCRAGATASRVYGTLPGSNAVYPAVYDTWSLHYEYNRRKISFGGGGAPFEVGDEDQDGIVDRGSNSIDDDDANGVDDVLERETQPPYAVPLKGIQVRIRTFEPASRQVREVTIIQRFRTK